MSAGNERSGEPSSTWTAVREEFEVLAELDEREREAGLLRLEADRPELARELRQLFAAEALDPDFLAGSAPLPENFATIPGGRIGAYEIVRPLGVGGMGAVYLARRADGRFERQVAIKRLRPELVSPELTRRLTEERRTLAALDHPGIARLLDGGESADGTPYLVLEYIDGLPLTRYAEERQLGVGARLRLFLRVLEAVAYAHRHLVVHRDLKPANILVTTAGPDEGQVKLLDFGIARLLDPERPDAPGVTGTLFRALTPEYASPEQHLGAATSTATDIYSLGVVLFELLTGERPYRVTSPTPAAWADAALHQAPTRSLTGDLDAIVGKALRKEPDERYATVESFADDVEAVLEHRPVSARRGEISYRASKFLRRHRGSLAAAGLAALAIAATLTVSALRLARERDRAEHERDRAQAVSNFLSTLFQAADPGRTKGAKLTAREVLDQARERVGRELAGQPELQASLLVVLGSVYRDLGQLAEAEEPLRQALALRQAQEDELALSETLHELRVLERMRGGLDDAVNHLEKALSIRERRLGPSHLVVGATLAALGTAERARGNGAEAVTHLERAVALSRELQPRAVDTGRWLSNLGLVYQDAGRFAEAKEAFSQAAALLETNEGPASPLAALPLDNLGQLLRAQGEAEASLAALERGRALVERSWGTRHPQYGNLINSLGYSLAALGRHDEAIRHFEEAEQVYGEALGPDHPNLAWPLSNRAESLVELGRTSEALPLYKRALAIRRAALGEEHPDVATSWTDLGRALVEAGELDRAEAHLRTALSAGRKAFSPESASLGETLFHLGLLLERRRRRDEAVALLEQANSIFSAIYPPEQIYRRETAKALGRLR